MLRGNAIAAGRSLVDSYSSFATNSTHTARFHFVQRSNIFRPRFVSPKFQNHFYLVLCQPGVDQHTTLATEKSCIRNVYFILRGDVFQLHFISSKIQYLFNLFQSKFDVGAFSHVLSVCKRFQMVGVDAAAHVAEMVKLQSFRDRPNDQVVEVPMRASTAAKDFRVAVAQKAIAACFANVALPDPARRDVSSVFQHKSVRQFLGVAIDVVFRLAFFVSRSFVSPSRNRCLLFAPTLAKAIIHTGTLPSTSISLGVA